jgi:hypothetical protein
VANDVVTHPEGIVTVQAVVPFGQQAPLPNVLKQTLAVQVDPLPRKLLEPKLAVASPHPEATVREHTPAVEQHAPVMQGLEVQVVPTPWKVWLVVAAHPAMVFREQTPAVEQQAPAMAGQGLNVQMVSLPMYVSPEAPQAPVAPLPVAGLTVQVEPSEPQHAPVGTVQGLGEQVVPAAKVLGRAHAVPATREHAPLEAQQTPREATHAPAPHVEPVPRNTLVPVQPLGITPVVQAPVAVLQHAPPKVLAHTPVGQVVPRPRNTLVPVHELEATDVHAPALEQHAPAQTFGVHAPPRTNAPLVVQPVVTAAHVAPLQHAPTNMHEFGEHAPAEMNTAVLGHPVVVAAQVVPVQHAPVWANPAEQNPSAAIAAQHSRPKPLRINMTDAPSQIECRPVTLRPRGINQARRTPHARGGRSFQDTRFGVKLKEKIRLSSGSLLKIVPGWHQRRTPRRVHTRARAVQAASGDQPGSVSDPSLRAICGCRAWSSADPTHTWPPRR